MDNYQSHAPSKWTVALVFMVILFLMIGVFTWAFYLNKGVVRFQAEKKFTIEGLGSSYICVSSLCEFSLTPGRYEAIAKSEGYYDEQLSFEVIRNQNDLVEVHFRLIPYLRVAPELPSEDLSQIRIVQSDQLYQLVSLDDDEILSFDTLKDPVLDVGRAWATIVDQGRLFLVDLMSKRSRKYFDDTVLVRSALISDSGLRVLVFGSLSGNDQVMLLKTEDHELQPLNILPLSDHLVWKPDSDYLVYVLSNELQDDQEASIFDDLLTSVSLGSDQKPWGLYELNLDSGRSTLIKSFDLSAPVRLMRRNTQIFAEYDDGHYEELITE